MTARKKPPCNTDLRNPSRPPSPKKNEYVFTVPAQQAKDTLTLKAGDALHRFRIEPTIRPELADLHALPPHPARLPPAPRPRHRGHPRHHLRPRRQPDHPLRLHRFRPPAHHRIPHRHPRCPPAVEADSEEDFLEEKEYRHQKAPPKPFTAGLKINKDNFTTPPITLTTYDLDIPITWTDIHGLEASSPFKLRIESLRDQPPAIYTQGTEKQIVLLPEETVTLELNAEDDFGIKEIGLVWSGQFTKPTDEQPAKGELLLQKGSPSGTRLNAEALFSPKTHNIPPQKLTLHAYATDYKPGRERTLSEPITLYILTLDEHAQLLKNRFDRVIGELEDIARQEQNNLDENQRLDQQNDGEKLQEEEKRQKLAQQELAEQENAEKMKELSKKMEDIFKDAVRNKDIDKDTMKKMAESLQQMKELGEKDLPKVEEKLKDSQNRKSTSEKTKEDLQKAVEKQKEAVEKMKETIEKANKANENFEAATFVNRLKRAASDEEGIASSIISEFTKEPEENISPLIGNDTDDSSLDPTHKRFINELSTQQKRTASDIRWIQEDLGHFYARTQKEIHKELMTEMRESGIDLALVAIRSRLEANHTFKSIPIASKSGPNATSRMGPISSMANSNKTKQGQGGDGDGAASTIRRRRHRIHAQSHAHGAAGARPPRPHPRHRTTQTLPKPQTKINTLMKSTTAILLALALPHLPAKKQRNRKSP